MPLAGGTHKRKRELSKRAPPPPPPTRKDTPPIKPNSPRRAVAAKAAAKVNEDVLEQDDVRAPSPSEDESDAPQARTQKVRKTAAGSVKASALAKRELKRGREANWKTWCSTRRWTKEQDPNYKQKVGDREVHRSEAMRYFRLKDWEIDTLPYVAFPNAYNPNSFGRSYNLSNLRTLVSRKFAYLAGLDTMFDPQAKEDTFLKEGWKLHEQHVKELVERMEKKGKKRKALAVGTIFEIRRPGTNILGQEVKPRPMGSWSTAVYEDGKYIGDWLNFQFDPEAGDFEDFYGSFERFRPAGADWVWE